VLYTDGVTDLVGTTGRFGEARLVQALQGASGADDTVARIDRAISAFGAGAPIDDTAVLAVERVAVRANSTELAAGLAA
jgi:serine phosphatase RsbU (regulator of sigma subunit)